MKERIKSKTLWSLSVQREGLPAPARQLHPDSGGRQATPALGRQWRRGRLAGWTHRDPRAMEVSQHAPGGAEEKAGFPVERKFGSEVPFRSRVASSHCLTATALSARSLSNTSVFSSILLKTLSYLAWTGKVSQFSALRLSGKFPNKVSETLIRLSKWLILINGQCCALQRVTTLESQAETQEADSIP